jgi:hypothetical protein
MDNGADLWRVDLLDMLEPKNHVPITDIHIYHGDIYIARTTENGPETTLYNMIGNLVLPDLAG